MKILLILLILSSSSAFPECGDSISNPCPAPSAEFVAYQSSDPLPIVLGDQDGHRVLEKEYDLPVHFGYPIRSYRILGTVVLHGVNNASGGFDPKANVRSLVSAAKAHGAEAVIMLRLTDDERATVRSEGAPAFIAKALAITWRMDGFVPKKPRGN